MTKTDLKRRTEMAYDEKTLKPLHKLTERGKIEYELMLERKADEILYKHDHPVKAALEKIKDLLKSALG